MGCRRGMRRIAVVVLIAGATLAAPLLAAGTRAGVQVRLTPQPSLPLLGMRGSQRASFLARLDPSTLRPTAARQLKLPAYIAPYSYSPDRSRLVLGSNDTDGTLFLVDARRLRLLKTIRSQEGAVSNIAWVGGRILVTRADGAEARIEVIDPGRGTDVADTPLAPGLVMAAGRTSHELVLLLSPPTGVGPCSLATVDAD